MSEERARYAGMWPSQSEAIAKEAVERLEEDKHIAELEAEKDKYKRELDATRKMLRMETESIGDGSWPDNLHLADVVEKYLARPIYETLKQHELESSELEAEVAELREQLDLQVRPEALREMKAENVRLREIVEISLIELEVTYRENNENSIGRTRAKLLHEKILKALTEKE